MTGLVPPVGADGNVGDIYFDLETGTVYGPKTLAGWPVLTAIDSEPTAATDSALSVTSAGQTLSIAVATTEHILAFPTDGVSVGSAIVRVAADDDTFQFVDAGVYKISYALDHDVSLSVFGELEVRVGGSTVIDAGSWVNTDLDANGVLLVEAGAGDSLELWVTGVSLAAGTETVNYSGSLVIELIATT